MNFKTQRENFRSKNISAKEAVQLHGGMGVTEEMSVGHYLKRLLVITNLFGSSDYFLDKYIES